MSVEIYLLVITALVSLLYHLITRHSDYWKKRGILGPKPSFFFGNLKDVILRRTTINEQVTSFYTDYPNEKVVGFFRLTTPHLLVRDLDLIQYIMIKDFDNFVDRGTQEFGEKGLSQNLFMTSGEKWRVLRTRFSPLFSFGKLKNMFYLVNGCGDRFLEHIEPILKKNPEQDAYALVHKFTISAISSCAFGLDINLDDYDVATYAKLDSLIFSPNYLAEISFLFPGLFDYINVPIFPEPVRKFFYNLIETIMKQRGGKPGNRKDFMDLMLELKNAGEIKGPKKREDEEDRLLKITDDLLAAQAGAFYSGGYETSATTLSFMLHELALNQDIQDRVVSEINDVLAKHDDKLTLDILKEMTYLTQVFDEVLRKYPIVDPLHRIAKESYTFPGTNITVEKGIVCQVPVKGIHYDEKYYPDPYKFDPERFSPENVKSRHPCAYLPFGVGSRNCIGTRFAKMQSGVCAVKLLRKYRVEPSPATLSHLTYDPNRILLRSKNGYPVKLLPR